MIFFFFFNDTATTEIYTLSLHDALPIYIRVRSIPCARFLPLLLGWSAGHAAISAPFRAPRGIAADGNGNFQLGVQSAEPGLLKGMRVAPNGQTKRAPELSNASLFVSLSVPGRIGLA